jgi:hypothetical protein
MDWLTQNWIWIPVVITAVVLFRRMGRHGFGGAGHHGYGAGDLPIRRLLTVRGLLRDARARGC